MSVQEVPSRIKWLLGTSIGMLVSLMIGAVLDWPKLIGAGVLVWGFNVFYCLAKLAPSGFSLVDALGKRIADAKRRGKRVETHMYRAALPLIALGLIQAALILYAFFFNF